MIYVKDAILAIKKANFVIKEIRRKEIDKTC